MIILEITVNFLGVMQTSEKIEIFAILKKWRIFRTLYRLVGKRRRRSLTVQLTGE